VIRENPASRGTETSAEVLVGRPMWHIHCRFKISEFRPQNASPGCGCVRTIGAIFQNAEFRYQTTPRSIG